MSAMFFANVSTEDSLLTAASRLEPHRVTKSLPQRSDGAAQPHNPAFFHDDRGTPDLPLSGMLFRAATG